MSQSPPLPSADDDLEMSLSEDDLISGLKRAQGHQVEVIAFGIAYAGQLTAIDIKRGFVTVVDGNDQASLEFERIESFRLLD